MSKPTYTECWLSPMERRQLLKGGIKNLLARETAAIEAKQRRLTSADINKVTATMSRLLGAGCSWSAAWLVTRELVAHQVNSDEYRAEAEELRDQLHKAVGELNNLLEAIENLQ